MGFMSACPGSQSLKHPTPEEIVCRGCGAELEIWTDEIHVRCKRCDTVTTRRLGPSCIDWCNCAESCIGPVLYRRLKA